MEGINRVNIYLVIKFSKDFIIKRYLKFEEGSLKEEKVIFYIVGGKL